jgi:dienelactone hydrolase
MKNAIKTTIAALLAAASMLASAGQVRNSLTADDTRGEISFMSVEAHANMRDMQAAGKPELNTELTGVLSFPGVFGTKASANNKVPAVILMHASNGPSKAVKAWADYLNGIGVATFMIDAFGGRGIKNTGEDQSQMSREAGAIDALVALKLLATHPFIDASHIAAMGFSKGAVSAQMSSFQNLNDLVLGPNSDVKMAGHIAFYGGCSVAAKTTGAPILMLVGEAEDKQPLATCRHTYELMKMKGANISFVSYPGAYHAFDTSDKIVFHPNSESTPTCRAIVDFDSGNKFYVPNAANPMQAVGRPEMLGYQCGQQRGGTTGGDFNAARDSREQVANFVKTYLSAK